MSTPTDDQSKADRYFVKAGEGATKQPFPGITIRTSSGDAMMFSVVHLDAGSVVPEHAHPHEQMGLLLSGRAEFTVGGVTRVLEEGDIWRIPGDVPHQVRAIDGPCVALDVFHPIREDYR